MNRAFQSARPQPEARQRQLARLYMTGATVSLMVVGMLACLPAPSANAATLAAVFPPWWSSSRIWAAAMREGDILDVGGSAFVLVLHARGPALEARLHRAGALIVLDPRELGPCGANARKAES